MQNDANQTLPVQYSATERTAEGKHFNSFADPVPCQTAISNFEFNLHYELNDAITSPIIT